MRTTALIALILAATVTLLACVTILPEYLTALDLDGSAVEPIALAEARNDVRTTLLQAFGGMVLLVGAYLTWHQTQISRATSREELRLNRESLLIERFAHAIEQLGSDEVAVRVGGIYALGRIADESSADRAAIADTLSAYVRRRAPFPPDPNGPHPADAPIDQVPHLAVRAPDVQAALTVLGRGTPSQRNPASWISIDLARTDLRRADLNGADLRHARLRGASLRRSWLHRTDLLGADLRETELGGASLREAIADVTTWWPGPPFDPAAEGIRVRDSLEHADLRAGDFRHDDLASVSLRGARANAFTEWPEGFDWRAAGVTMDDPQ